MIKMSVGKCGRISCVTQCKYSGVEYIIEAISMSVTLCVRLFLTCAKMYKEQEKT